MLLSRLQFLGSVGLHGTVTRVGSRVALRQARDVLVVMRPQVGALQLCRESCSLICGRGEAYWRLTADKEPSCHTVAHMVASPLRASLR